MPKSNIPKRQPIMDRFFMVIRAVSDNPQPRWTLPVIKHATQQEAHDEARRLSEANPGLTFVVLRSEKTYRTKAPRRRVDRRG